MHRLSGVPRHCWRGWRAVVSFGLVSLLTGLGWNAYWEAAYAPFAANHIAGRIRIVHRGIFNVLTESIEYDAEPSPKLRQGKDER